MALAEDALRLARVLRLVVRDERPDGTIGIQLTEAERRVADVASRPIWERGESHDRVIRDTLAERILTHWLGTGGLVVADLFVNGARRLADAAHVGVRLGAEVVQSETDGLDPQPRSADHRSATGQTNYSERECGQAAWRQTTGRASMARRGDAPPPGPVRAHWRPRATAP